MDLKPIYARAWVLGCAVVIASGCAKREIAISKAPIAPPLTAPVTPPPASPVTAPLPSPATGEVIVSTEPFLNPFGTKKPKIVSGYGKRDVPPSLVPVTTGPVLPLQEMHEGVDYRAFPGSAVKAARSGKVIFAGFSKTYASRADKTDQQRLVIVRHSDGLSSRYVHLSVLRVKPGQEVQCGQVLGILDESDEWTEPVLHFEIRDIRGQPLDPAKLITEVAVSTPVAKAR